MSKKSISVVAAIVIFASTAIVSSGHAQDIEFLGKNGERVELTPKIESLPGPPVTEALPSVPDPRSPAQIPRGRGVIASSPLGGLPSLKGRTLVVTTPDGGTKEISTDDAHSIIVNRSFSTVNEDGQQQIQQGGTATIVAADGETYQVDLSQIQGGENDAQADSNQTLQAKQIEVPKSYRIGVFCEPVPEMLSSQLDLAPGVGLIVKEVQPGSPASIAGVQKHDVLLYADDQVLGSVKDLAEAIDQSGAQNQPFSLTVMRAGSEIPIEITAQQREFSDNAALGRMPLGGFQMNDLGPGLIFEGRFGNGLEDRMMEQMRNQMEQVREEMKRMDAILQNGLPIPMLPEIPLGDQIR